MTVLSQNLPKSSAPYRRMMASAISLLCVHSKVSVPRTDWIIAKLIGRYNNSNNYIPTIVRVSVRNINMYMCMYILFISLFVFLNNLIVSLSISLPSLLFTSIFPSLTCSLSLLPFLSFSFSLSLPFSFSLSHSISVPPFRSFSLSFSSPPSLIPFSLSSPLSVSHFSNSSSICSFSITICCTRSTTHISSVTPQF